MTSCQVRVAGQFVAERTPDGVLRIGIDGAMKVEEAQFRGMSSMGRVMKMPYSALAEAETRPEMRKWHDMVANEEIAGSQRWGSVIVVDGEM